MPPSPHVESSKASSAHAGPSPRTQATPNSVLHDLRCTPSRRSLKFTAGPQSRHFLAFDTSISREDRLLLFMELFVFRELLVDAAVLPHFQVAPYTPEELLEVRVVTDPRHPAYGQAGLYAKSAISHNTIVTPYSGFIEVFATSCNSRTYTMGFGSIGDDYALDAEFVGNYGRYANDPRGVGTLQANLSAENRFNVRGESFTALVARRQISAGEEILMSYGKAHRLSSTPWMNIQGEAIMRPRVGAVVPFPSFRTTDNEPTSAAPAALAASKREDEHNHGEHRQRQFVDPSDSLLDTAQETPAAPTAASETASTLRHSHAVPSMANDLLWECTQCGMWNFCEASMADSPHPCSHCQTPKLSAARLMSLLSSPAVTQQTLLEEAGPSQLPPPPPPQRAAPCSPPPPSLSATSGSASFFSSEHADWPMNVPFLPWQVWDAAVPLSVLAKHSRFETQGHMFLYTVDTGLGEEKKRGREKTSPARAGSRATRRARTALTKAEDESNRGGDTRHRSSSSASSSASFSGSDNENKEFTKLSAPPQSRTLNARVRGGRGEAGRGGGRGRGRGRGRGGPTAAAAARLKKGVLWERQGDVDVEELAKLNRGFAPSTPLAASPISPEGSTSAMKIASRASVTSPFSAFRDGTAHVDDDVLRMGQAGKDWDDVEACLTPPASPLHFLLPSSQELDRLLVLRRAASITTANTSASTQGEAAFSPQLVDLRRRLQCMTRRLFTGRHFQTGDVVSYVGGLVRQRGDPRCRVADSCLEIPLRYFLPPSLRRLCARDQLSSSSSTTAHRGAEDGCAGEGTMLHRFCRRLDELSLVVTNEFMYCPCIVCDDAAGDASVTGDGWACKGVNDGDVESAFMACNVALVLTLDSLGCPYACAVATKPIAAFEPILARAQ